MVYRRGGPAATAIDIRVQSLFTNGWKITGDDPNLNQAVTERLKKLDWERQAKMAVRDGYLYAWGIHEIAPTNDGTGIALVTRASRDFTTEEDDSGNVLKFKQRIMADPNTGRAIFMKKEVELPAEKAIQIIPIPTSDRLGISLIERARNQIEWHYMVSQSSADSIWRHGYPKWDIQLQEQDGSQIPTDVIAGMEGVTTDLKPTSEMVMNALSKVVELDKGGIPQVESYSNWALTELAAAIGVPELFFGMGHRSTEATATVQLRAFYDSVATDGFSIAQQYQSALIDDIILPDLGAKGGDSVLQFQNPNPENQSAKADYLAKVIALNPMNPEWLLSRDELLAELGIQKSNDDMTLQQPQPQPQKGVRPPVYSK
jgi:hypothetical protein